MYFSSLAIVGVAAWIFVTGPIEDAPDEFDRVWDQRDTIDSLSATFRQETVGPDEVIESSGSIVYVNPKRILFRYDDPPVTYLIDAKRSYEYDEELEQVLIYDLDGGPEAEAFFLGFENNRERVLEAYDLGARPAEDPERFLFTLILTPKEKDEEQTLFERVFLNISKDHSLPTENQDRE